MLSEQVGLLARERCLDGGDESGKGRVGALGQVVMLDGAEDTIDVVELGTIRRQIVQGDAALPQLRDRVLHIAGAMKAGVIQDDDQRQRGAAAHRQQADQLVAGQMNRAAMPVQEGRGACGCVQGHHVVAAPLRILVRHPLSCLRGHPRVGHRLAGGEAALVEIGELKPPRPLPFPRLASTRAARATRAGSCLWRRLWVVRRQRASIRFRYLRVWRVLSAMPCSFRAVASCAAVQVRSWPRSGASAVVTCVRRSRLGAGPGRWRCNPATPVAGNCLSTVRTVAAQYPRCWAIAGGLQPVAESSTISTRSRSAGVNVGSRRAVCNAARWSSVSWSRIISHCTKYKPTEASCLANIVDRSLSFR